MIGSAFYTTLEEKLGPVAGIAAAVGIVLHVLGYLSMRFWLRSLGLRPTFNVLSEVFLFEGASMLIFLLTAVGPLLIAALVLGGLVALARRIPALRRGLDALPERARNLSALQVAVLGALWGAVTLQFLLRHVLLYRDLVQHGLPCHPSWLRAVAFSDGPLEVYFFSMLLLLPVPTLWALSRLPGDAPAWRPVTAILSLVALVQILLVPIHYGVLTGHAFMPRVEIASDEAKSGRTWQVYSTDTHVHLLTVDDGTPPLRRIRVVPTKEIGPVEIVDVDQLFEILSEGQTCGP